MYRNLVAWQWRVTSSSPLLARQRSEGMEVSNSSGVAGVLLSDILDDASFLNKKPLKAMIASH